MNCLTFVIALLIDAFLESWVMCKICWLSCIIELSIKSPSVSPPISCAFTPYPLFQWYPQSKDILWNMGMKCWNSAFNAQGSRIIIVVVHVGAVKIYAAAVQALRKKETQDENSVYHQNWWKKLVWVLVISFSKIFIPSYPFDALLCRNWPFSPPNRLTLCG